MGLSGEQCRSSLSLPPSLPPSLPLPSLALSPLKQKPFFAFSLNSSFSCSLTFSFLSFLLFFHYSFFFSSLCILSMAPNVEFMCIALLSQTNHSLCKPILSLSHSSNNYFQCIFFRASLSLPAFSLFDFQLS